MFSEKFICATHDYSSYTHFVPAPLFRKSFELNKMPLSCSVTVGAAGFYELFINGIKITKGALAPYISNPDHIVYYDEYNLMPYISEGKNTLGLLLGDGMQNAPGGQIWDFDIAAFRAAPRAAFALEISDGESTKILEADSGVKTAPSAVIFNDLRCGCFYDARLETPGWCEPSFDDSGWGAAIRAETPRGEKRLCAAEPILPYNTLKAAEIRKCVIEEYRPRGDVVKEKSSLPLETRTGWLYDFGVNSSGIPLIKISGKKGQQVDFQFGEYINEKGNPDYSNINFYPQGFSQRDIYILKSEGEEQFSPYFTYHGARYCVVLGIEDEQATPELVSFVQYSSALSERGAFSCSDDTAQRLQAMVRNSTLSNFFYFPTDCPHREKNGWTGDASVSAEHMTLNLAPEKSYREWLNNIRKAQREDGSLPGIVPTGGWGYHWGNGPAWDEVLINLPYTTYIYRGDKDILRENAASIFRYCEYLSTHRTACGTVELGLGDWCPTTVVKAPLELTDSLISMDILKKASFIFSELSQPLKKQFCDGLYSDLRAAVRRELIDLNTMTAIGSSQSSQAMAIYYGAFSDAEKPEAFRRLLGFIKDADYHMDGGLLGLRVLFRVLSDFGESELAFRLITQRSAPSYGDFVERGLSALPEFFDKESESSVSLNHHFFGDISAWFIMYIAGIRINPRGAGADTADIRPAFISQLENAAAHYITIKGGLYSSWKKENGGYLLEITAPDGISGRIYLPDGFVFTDSGLCISELKSGEYKIEKRG